MKWDENKWPTNILWALHYWKKLAKRTAEHGITVRHQEAKEALEILSALAERGVDHVFFPEDVSWGVDHDGWLQRVRGLLDRHNAPIHDREPVRSGSYYGLDVFNVTLGILARQSTMPKPS